jgi:hypothetical protein
MIFDRITINPGFAGVVINHFRGFEFFVRDFFEFGHGRQEINRN